MEAKNHSRSQLASISWSALFSALLVIGVIGTVEVFSPEYQNYDEAKIQGIFTIIHEDKDGNVLSYQQVENLINNEGLECSADLLFGTSGCVGEAVFQYMGIGTSAVAPADTDTGLGAESGTCPRVQDATPSLSVVGSGIRGITLTVIFTGALCESQTFAEVGIFDASSSGNMIARTLLSPTVSLGSGDTLTVNYEIRLNN